jgi:hypothetical protein
VAVPTLVSVSSIFTKTGRESEDLLISNDKVYFWLLINVGKSI